MDRKGFWETPTAGLVDTNLAILLDSLNFDPSHRAAHEILRNQPEKFDVTLDDRDRALIDASPVEGVAFGGNSCIYDMIYAEPGAPLGQHGKVTWHEDNDDQCRAMLADAGQVVYEKKARPVAVTVPKVQKSINVKIRLFGKPSGEFEVGSLTAHGSAPGDIRIFKGPRVRNQGAFLTPAFGARCDGMIIRNAVASGVSLHGTKLDKVWDILLINSPQYSIPWIVCAMKEVDEPGGRVINRACTVKGVWGTSALQGGIVPWADNPQPKATGTMASFCDAGEAIMSEQRYKEVWEACEASVGSKGGVRFFAGNLGTANSGL